MNYFIHNTVGENDELAEDTSMSLQLPLPPTQSPPSTYQHQMPISDDSPSRRRRRLTDSGLRPPRSTGRNDSSGISRRHRPDAILFPVSFRSPAAYAMTIFKIYATFSLHFKVCQWRVLDDICLLCHFIRYPLKAR